MAGKFYHLVSHFVLELKMRNFLYAVLVVVAGGIIVLLIEYNMFSVERKIHPEKTLVANIISNDEDSTSNATQEDASPIPPKDDSDSIRAKLTLAKSVYGTSARNKSLEFVLELALRVPDFHIAIEAADGVYGTAERNEAYISIIDEALRRHNVPVAKDIVKKLYGTEVRNSQIEKILKDGS